MELSPGAGLPEGQARDEGLKAIYACWNKLVEEAQRIPMGTSEVRYDTIEANSCSLNN